MPNFLAVKFPESIKWYNTKNRNISFEYPKNPYINQATQKVLAKIFHLKQIPESKISNPKQFLQSSLSLEIQRKAFQMKLYE